MGQRPSASIRHKNLSRIRVLLRTANLPPLSRHQTSRLHISYRERAACRFRRCPPWLRSSGKPASPASNHANARARPCRRFVYPAPNACWQIDATEYVLTAGRKCVIFQLIDDHSRLAVASHVSWTESAQGAIAVVTKPIRVHGVPQRPLSDNGMALNPSRRGFSGQLVTYLASFGVEAITGKPFKPTTQGKNERFHQTLFRYLDKQPIAATLQQLQEQGDQFDIIYNTQRPHQALPGRCTPSRPGWPPRKPNHPDRPTRLPARPPRGQHPHQTRRPRRQRRVPRHPLRHRPRLRPQASHHHRHRPHRRVLRPRRHPHHRATLALTRRQIRQQRPTPRPTTQPHPGRTVTDVLRHQPLPMSSTTFASDVPRHHPLRSCRRCPETSQTDLSA